MDPHTTTVTELLDAIDAEIAQLQARLEETEELSEIRTINWHKAELRKLRSGVRQFLTRAYPYQAPSVVQQMIDQGLIQTD